MDVQPNDPAPQQETPTRVVDRVTEHTIRFETWVGYNSTWKYCTSRGPELLPLLNSGGREIFGLNLVIGSLDGSAPGRFAWRSFIWSCREAVGAAAFYGGH